MCSRGRPPTQKRMQSASREIGDASRCKAALISQGSTPKGPKCLVERFGSLGYPVVIRWIIGGRVHIKPNARKVTHPSVKVKASIYIKIRNFAFV